jgi:hypothetical protein
MITITRTFHSVGHGAFYTEKHFNDANNEQLNIVYDCGSLGKIANLKPIIKNAYSPNDWIDYLFISHLDKDHISGINELNKRVNKKFKNVIMPLLNNIDKLFIMGKWEDDEVDEFGDLVIEPEVVFSDPHIIFIKKANPLQYDIEYEQTINQNEHIRINESGSVIFPSSVNEEWIFKHYNYCESERIIQFERELNKIGLGDIKTYKGKQLLNLLKSRKKDIKECYNNIDGDINENSMIIYSGPDNNIDGIYQSFQASVVQQPQNFKWINKPACIYTGDSDCNKNDLSKIFDIYWEHIGTIQIPHHGSINNYNHNNIFGKSKGFYCLISCNSLDSLHPNIAVSSDIDNSGHCHVCVTEDTATQFTETFQYQE